MKIEIESRVNLVIDVLVEDKKFRFEAEANSPLTHAREAGIRFVAEIDRQIQSAQEAEAAKPKEEVKADREEGND